MIGEVLGNRYELVEKIGEGGMAIVYKARDNKLSRLVAVKVLKKEFANNKDISDKFKKEATAVANFSDANIVNVLDVGHEEEGNIDYFVMEYVNGKTLKELIVGSGKLNYTTAISIAIQIAKALECAHKNNIIHRDVKPQNILVTESGLIKVTDFGIAKSSTSATITNTTTIMGSAHYLSPEQAKGSFVDLRSDIYSLGVVLYEMVTGVLPFDGESPVTIALKHIQSEPIEPKKQNQAIPDSLNNLIMKCMSKECINRYQNCRELINDLQKIKVVDINQFMDYLAYYVSDEDSQLYSNGENGKARKLAAVRKLFKYFYRTEKISSNPAELTITPKRHEKEIVRLEPNEVAEMLDVIENGSKMTSKQKEYYEKTKTRDLAIVTLLLGTGLRVSECVGLDIDDVDFDVNGVRVLRKGSKEMIVYFGEEVEIALKDYLVQRKAIETAPEYEKALFLSMQKKRIGVRAVEKLVKKYASQVTTLKKISPHKLRSTYGTTLYRETGDIYLVADVLGHSDVNTTKKHYAQQSDDNRRRAARIVKLREE